ncbi:uncharacterized protein WM294_013171 isoform 2-T5 [Sarcoramphus papa]
MSGGLKEQLFFRCRSVGEVRSIPCCLCFTGGTRASTWQPVNSRGRAGERPRCCKRLRGAKPHAEERSEKVRRLLAGSVSNSKGLYGNLVKHFSLVLQAPCRQPLELDEHLRCHK